jgi:TLC domain
LLVDGVIGLLKGYLKVEMMFHHLCGLVMINQAYYMNQDSHIMLICFALGEISNPFLNSMELLEFYGARTVYKAIAGIGFSVTFTICRAFVMPILVRGVYSTDMNIFFMLELAAMTTLGFVWVWSMANKFVKTIAELLPSS